MTQREEFLARVARAIPEQSEASPLPALNGLGSTRADPQRDFQNSLQAAAGRALLLSDYEHLEAALSQLDCYRHAKRVCTTVPGVLRSNVNQSAFEDPRSLSQIDVAVLRAELGVAENGAVWIAPKNIMERALLFLSEHVVVLLDKSRIVDDMHRAYEAIAVNSASFGCFVSGPSKTADIEQALVIGAHGPRSFSVVLV